MLNDLSSTLSLLETRRSGRPREMVGPGPSEAEMERILAIAARSPDHGKLFPWRFVTVGPGQRDALAALLREALAEHDHDATAAHQEKEDAFAHYAGQLAVHRRRNEHDQLAGIMRERVLLFLVRRSGVVIVLVSAPVHGHKIPVWEQELSCGAAGMNLLLAAHALGYVGGWVTGWRAYDERVRAAFCGPGERIAGFLFIGKPGAALQERPRAPLATVTRPWVPPAI